MLEQQSQMALERQQIDSQMETQRVQQEAQSQIQATQAQLQKAQLEAQKAKMDAQQAKQEVQMERQRAKLEQEGNRLEGLLNTPAPTPETPEVKRVSPEFAERLGRLTGHLDKLTTKRERVKRATTGTPAPAPQTPVTPPPSRLDELKASGRTVHEINPNVQVGSDDYKQFIANQALQDYSKGMHAPGTLFKGENSKQYLQDYEDARSKLIAPELVDPWEKWKATGQSVRPEDMSNPRWYDYAMNNGLTNWGLNHFRPLVVGAENAGQSAAEGKNWKAVGQYAGGVLNTAGRLGFTAMTGLGLKNLAVAGAAKIGLPVASPAVSSGMMVPKAVSAYAAGKGFLPWATRTGILGANVGVPIGLDIGLEKLSPQAHAATESLANTAQADMDIRDRAAQFQDRMQKFKDTTGIQDTTFLGSNPSLHTINRMGTLFPQYSAQTPDYGGGWRQILMELLAQWFGPRYNPQYRV